MDYDKLEENKTFAKCYTGKYLAYKIISETVPRSIIPVDTLEVDLFFKQHFKGSPIDVFRRYCQFHDLDVDDTLGLYKSALKWDLIYKPNKKQDLTEELESLSDCFLKMLAYS